MLGTFALPAHSPFADSTLTTDKALFSIFRMGNSYYCKNIETGDTTEVEISVEINYNNKGTSSAIDSSNYKTLKVNIDNNTSLVCVHYSPSELTDEALKASANGLKDLWGGIIPKIDDLRKVHYFITANEYMVFVSIPIMRIARND